MDIEKNLKTARDIEKLLKKGYSIERIKSEVKNFSDEALSIAKARIKNNRTEKIPCQYIFNEEDLRFATNVLAAKYRAKRLSCSKLIEIGCGIGVQSIEFSRKSKEVISIDNDSRKISYAIFNASIAGSKNIEFISNDALKVIQKLKSADIIFWDPQRPPSENQRSLLEFNPPFNKMMASMKKITENICIELPPRMNPSSLPSCELEYISINNETNRLNAYFGSLNSCRLSVVSLPSETTLKDTGEKAKVIESHPKKYIHEVDEAVIMADLLPQLCYNLNTNICKINSKVYLTSAKPVKNPFLKSYEIIGTAKKHDLANFLSSRNIGKVILHGRISEKYYWSIKNEIEKSISGSKTSHLFFDKDNVMASLKI